MRSFIILLGVQARGLINSLAPGAAKLSRRARGRRLALMGVLSVLLGTFIVAYIVMLGLSLALLGATEAIVPLAIAAGALAGAAFTFIKARGTLFGTRDHDLIMAMPLPRRTVILARSATLFGANILLAILIMLPLYAVYFAFAGATAPSVLLALASAVLAPLPITGIAAFAAAGVTALSTRFRHANLAFIIGAMALMLVVLVAAYGWSFSMRADAGQAAASLGDTMAQISNTIYACYPPAAWATQGIVHGSVPAYAAFAAISIAVPAVCIEIMQRTYLGINDALAARSRGRARTRRDRAKDRSPFAAIVIKELRTLVGIPSYAFNCLFGYLLMIAAALAISLIGMRGILSSGVIDGVTLDPAQIDAAMGYIMLLFPWVFAFLATTCSSAAVSISLEGRSSWIMATAPLSPRAILGAKLASNALPCIACLGASAAAMLAFGEIDIFSTCEVVLVGFGMFFLWVNVGLAIDAAHPNFSWTVANEVVKRSASIMVCVLGGMVCAFALGALSAIVLPDLLGLAATHGIVIALGACSLIGGYAIFRHTARTTTFFIN